MIIVIPLRAIVAVGRFDLRREQAGAIVIILDHQMNDASGFPGEVADREAEIAQQWILAGFGDLMDSVQPQAVEAIIAQPLQRTLDGEIPHKVLAIIDRGAPRRAGLHEESRRIASEIISLGSEVVVDGVEKHHQAAQVRFVDQCFQIVRPSVAVIGRVPQHAVVTPVATAGKVVERHQFERRDSGRDQVIELVDHGAIGPLRGERADMGLEKDGVRPGPAGPCVGAPAIGRMVDDFAGSEYVVRLKQRRRIGHVEVAVDPVAIARAGACLLDRGDKPAVRLFCHRDGAIQHQIDGLGSRRPQPKGGPFGRDRWAKPAGAHGIPA